MMEVLSSTFLLLVKRFMKVGTITTLNQGMSLNTDTIDSMVAQAILALSERSDLEELKLLIALQLHTHLAL